MTCKCGRKLGPKTTTTDIGPQHLRIICRCGRVYVPTFRGKRKGGGK